MPIITTTGRRLRIVSDGTARSTVVYDANGDPVKWGNAGLAKIEIFPIVPDGLVRAAFTVEMVGLDLDVEDAAP